jgi:hypothetical protein
MLLACTGLVVAAALGSWLGITEHTIPSAIQKNMTHSQLKSLNIYTKTLNFDNSITCVLVPSLTGFAGNMATGGSNVLGVQMFLQSSSIYSPSNSQQSI